MQYPDHYAIFDLETTGLDTDTARIIEFAVLIRNGRQKTVASMLVKPDIFVPDKITEITGITQDMLEKEGMPEAHAVVNLVTLLGGLPVVGHNILRYDIPVLHSSAVRLGLSDAFNGSGLAQDMVKHAIDTAALVKARMMKLEAEHGETDHAFMQRVLDTKAYGVKYNLTAACEFLKIDTSDLVAHRAAADVEMVDRIYQKMCLDL